MRGGRPGARPWRLLLYGGLGCLLSVAVLVGLTMIRMPGRSYTGPLPPLTATEVMLQERLTQHVQTLAGDIGERHLWHPTALEAAARYIAATWQQHGYSVARQSFEVQGQTVANLEVELPGGAQRGEVVVVGGHYDSVLECPGANDNATGVAAVLEIARLLTGTPRPRTVRLVAFVNEEAPFFGTEAMGSWVYARRARARGERIVAMLSLETIGYYTDAADSQQYPAPFHLFYPRVGNFLGFVGDLASWRLVRRSIASFRRHTAFPSEGTAAPRWLTDIGRSDHWAFWQAGYPGVMLTDTAPFRYAPYHTRNDTPEQVDYARLARVVAGLARVVAELAGQEVTP